jgi:hypothetical protein
MLAITNRTISQALNCLNIMTYDMTDRSDNITKHHTGIAFYIRWSNTNPDGDCAAQPTKCRMVLVATGASRAPSTPSTHDPHYFRDAAEKIFYRPARAAPRQWRLLLGLGSGVPRIYPCCAAQQRIDEPVEGPSCFLG